MRHLLDRSYALQALKNDFIDLLELLSTIGFHITNHELRKSNLFHIMFYEHSYCSEYLSTRAHPLESSANCVRSTFFKSQYIFKYDFFAT